MARPQGKADPALAQLADELIEVTRRRLPETFKDPAQGDTVKFPRLAEVVQTLEPTPWDEDPTRALVVAVRRAVKKLPEAYPETPRKEWRSLLTWLEISEILCGLRPDLPSKLDGSLRGYSEYVAEVKVLSGFAASGLSDATFKRHVTREFRLHLARALLDLAEQPEAHGATTQPTNATAQAAAPNPLYAPRPALHDYFHELVEAGEKLIALVGLPGMGKSWLAKALAAHYGVSPSPIVHVADGQLFMPDLQTLIERYQVDTQRAIDKSAIGYWRLLLESEHAPRVLILDNLESTSQLNELVSSPSRPIVIATCRRAEHVPTGWQIISVGRMSIDEAITLVQKRLPDLSASDARILAAGFYEYPLIVDYACRLLGYSPAPVQEFYDQIRSDVHAVAGDALLGRADATLKVILKRLVAHLESVNRDSMALLLILALNIAWGSTPLILELALMWHQRQLILDYGRIARAYITLDEVMHLEDAPGDSVSFLRIHPLISNLVMGTFHWQMDYALTCLYKAVVIAPFFLAGNAGKDNVDSYADFGRAHFGTMAVMAELFTKSDADAIFKVSINPQLYREMHFWLSHSILSAESGGVLAAHGGRVALLEWAQAASADWPEELQQHGDAILARRYHDEFLRLPRDGSLPKL